MAINSIAAPFRLSRYSDSNEVGLWSYHEELLAKKGYSPRTSEALRNVYEALKEVMDSLNEEPKTAYID